MASDDGENTTTRFPCLAWLRTSVAIVVTVLVLVLLVMVITVVRRPEKISLSSYPYVQTQQPWWKWDDADDDQEAIAGSNRPPRFSLQVLDVAYLVREDLVQFGLAVANGLQGQELERPNVTMLVSVFAYNPSGRGSIDCNITTISIIDMPYDNFTEMVEIHRMYSPKMPLKFSVPPQTWHRDRRSVNITNQNVLLYLSNVHQQDRFRVMVQVNTTYKAQHSAASVNVSHYCWPVIFVYGYPYVDYRADVPCKTSEEMDYSVSWLPLPDGAGAAGGD